MDWIDLLSEKIFTHLAGYMKFKTHKTKKKVCGEVKTIMRDSIQANSGIDTHKRAGSKMQDAVTIINPNVNKSAGYAIMTEGMSAKGDDI